MGNSYQSPDSGQYQMSTSQAEQPTMDDDTKRKYMASLQQVLGQQQQVMQPDVAQSTDNTGSYQYGKAPQQYDINSLREKQNHGGLMGMLMKYYTTK